MFQPEYNEEEREFGSRVLSEVTSTEMNNCAFVVQQPVAGKQKCKATISQTITHRLLGLIRKVFSWKYY